MLSVSKLLQLTWNLYKKNLQVFLGYSAWILVPYIFIIIVKMIPLETTISGSVINLLLAAQVMATIWIVIVTTVVTSAVIRKKRLKLDNLGRKAFTRMLPVIAVVILSLIIMAGGLILLVIPGLIFSVWYCFAAQEIILRNKRGWDAMNESRALVRGRFWKIVGRVIGGELFISLCYIFAISIVISLVSIILGAPEPTMKMVEIPMWTDILINIAEMIVLPLFIIYHTLLYLDARAEHKKQSKSI